MPHRFGSNIVATVTALGAACMLAACGGGGPGSSTMPMSPGSTPATTAPMADLHQFDAADRAVADRDRGDSSAVLAELTKTTTIGSTVPSNGDQNPYGLDIAPANAGLLHRGDLVVGNFNDAA